MRVGSYGIRAQRVANGAVQRPDSETLLSHEYLQDIVTEMRASEKRPFSPLSSVARSPHASQLSSASASGSSASGNTLRVSGVRVLQQ